MSPNKTQPRASARYIVPVSNWIGNKGKKGRRTWPSILEYWTEDAIGMWDTRSGSGLRPIMLDKRTVLFGHQRFRLGEISHLFITLWVPRLRSCPRSFTIKPYLFWSNSASVTCCAKVQRNYTVQRHVLGPYFIWQLSFVISRRYSAARVGGEMGKRTDRKWQPIVVR